MPSRRPEPLRWFGASAVPRTEDVDLTGDPTRSLWATEGAFRLITLVYALLIHTIAAAHYTRPHLAGVFIAVQCIWTGAVAYFLYARPRWRALFAGADQVAAVALMLSTRVVAPESWWDHNQSLPTTMWVTNAVLVAGMMWGVGAGLVSAAALAGVSLWVGGDLSWWERSPTLPIFISAGMAAGIGAHSVRRAQAQLVAALELRARAAERERLARQVHDGVLQVLALMARRGAQLGGEAAELGHLAREQEGALRALIADSEDAAAGTASPGASSPKPAAQAAPARGFRPRRPDRGHVSAPDLDLRQALLARAAAQVRVSTGPEPVPVPLEQGRELLAAVDEALTNVRNHAGAGATAFVLLEDVGADLVVTVRDDGPGIPEERLDTAARQGRMGVSRSIVGRMASLGGSAVLHTAPDEGVEWEFTVPRRAGGRE